MRDLAKYLVSLFSFADINKRDLTSKKCFRVLCILQIIFFDFGRLQKKRFIKSVQKYLGITIILFELSANLSKCCAVIGHSKEHIHVSRKRL
jgi:hypothetical protein